MNLDKIMLSISMTTQQNSWNTIFPVMNDFKNWTVNKKEERKRRLMTSTKKIMTKDTVDFKRH